MFSFAHSQLVCVKQMINYVSIFIIITLNHSYCVACLQTTTYRLASHCPCRNTSHPNRWAYHTKPLLDNTAHGSQRRLSAYDKEFFRYNPEQNHHEAYNQTEQLSTDDHRIRITVNCDNEQSTFSGRNQNSYEESESAASVTIVEIDDSQQSDDETNTTTFIRNSLNDTPDKYINTSAAPYNEKPIDVPEDFERKAYEFQRNELSPFVRNLQPNSQVIPLHYFHIKFCIFVFTHIHNYIISTVQISFVNL